VAFLGWAGYQDGCYFWARSHHRAALEARERRDWTEALPHLRACLEVWPRDVPLYLLAARTARQAGLLEEAEQHLAACARLQGETEAWKLETALLRVQRGSLVEYEDELRTFLDRDHPDSPLILDVLTAALIDMRRLADARADLERWLQLAPGDQEALVRSGTVAERLDDFAAAARAYQQALAARPEDDGLRLTLAEVLIHLSRPEEAATHFDRLRERQPDHPGVLYGLARCRRLQGRTDDARRLLNAVLAKHPGDVQALHERGSLALEAGRASEAEDDLRRAAAVRPYDRLVLHNLYQCLQQLGKKDEAAEYAARVKRLSDELERIDADSERASRLAKQIKERAPHDPALRCELGILFLHNGYQKEGLYWLRTALREDPRHRPTHAALAEFYERTGQQILAVYHRQILGQLPPP
jgi:predicted Zn-dependent protease